MFAWLGDAETASLPRFGRKTKVWPRGLRVLEQRKSRSGSTGCRSRQLLHKVSSRKANSNAATPGMGGSISSVTRFATSLMKVLPGTMDCTVSRNCCFLVEMLSWLLLFILVFVFCFFDSERTP